MSPPSDVDADWWRQAVVYQVYPRSFADETADGIGDLPGVTSRVPYLSALGIDAVWLSPFYPSALADGGYDVDDYRDVDPRLGTLADFDALTAALHAAGIKLIVDIVPNHSSNLHAWFQAALSAPPNSPERARYVFRDGLGPGGAQPPSDWPSHFGGSAWSRVPDGQWYLHLFAEQQPDFNWDNPQVRDDFRATLRFWADRGVDGFRVDVAHALAKDLSEPLRSQPTIETFDLPLDGSSPLFDRDEVHTIYAEWREVFNEYHPPRTAVAEAWVANERRPLYARSSGLGQTFNFDLLKASWSAAEFHSVIENNLANASVSGTSSTWVLSNHDVVRHASRYALPSATRPDPEQAAALDAWLLSDGRDPFPDNAIGLKRACAATLLMLALPGSAYLYQGEELGLLEVADLSPEVLADPVWRRTLHRMKGRDGCRVPLPWTPAGSSFGFGTDGAHLPQPAWFADHAVATLDADPMSVLNLYREAMRLRRRLQTDEKLEWVEAPAGVLHFHRPNGWHSVTNFTADPVALTAGPPGSLVIASSPADGPRSDQVPGNTTLWFARSDLG